MNNIDLITRGLGIFDYKVLRSIRGGNSFVHQVLFQDDKIAIKEYVGEPDRQQRSLKYESEALIFLNQESLISCPKLISVYYDIPSIAYNWIEGETVSNEPSAKSAIASTIARLSDQTIVNKYPLIAIDAVLNTHDLQAQLMNRLDKIRDVAGIPAEILYNIDSLSSRLQSFLSQEIIFDSRVLSISDYGPHNLIRHLDGNYSHIDFEFFGVDSTVKMYADLFNHPQNMFTSFEIRNLIYSAKISKDIESMIFNILPAIALKWAFIVLRRHINWDVMKYKEVEFRFSNPMEYLSYAKFLIELRNIDQVITFKEFKEL